MQLLAILEAFKNAANHDDQEEITEDNHDNDQDEPGSPDNPRTLEVL